MNYRISLKKEKKPNPWCCWNRKTERDPPWVAAHSPSPITHVPLKSRSESPAFPCCSAGLLAGHTPCASHSPREAALLPSHWAP
ncbi:hypothetical protein VIGAN_04146700, partial [Vigna angularis var. angularis]